MNRPLISLILLAGLSASSWAQDARYVSDELYVPLRSGQGNQYRIVHKGLKSGTQLKWLETSEDGKWSLVELGSGDQGWIPSQYLMAEPTAELKLQARERELATLKAAHAKLQAELKALRQDKSATDATAGDLGAERDKLAQELAELRQLSGSAIDLHERHQALLEKHQVLQTRADVLSADNERLKRDQRYTQWLYGASILGVGMLITLLLQSFSGRRRRSEWIN